LKATHTAAAVSNLTYACLECLMRQSLIIAGTAALLLSTAATAQRADTLVARQYASIGSIDGAAEYVFGNITAVAEDAQRRIWVADRIGSTVRVYGPDGRFLRQLGREGDGPGEYRWPVDVRFRGDTAYVRDGNRVTVLVPRARGAIADSVRTSWRLPGYGNSASRAAAMDASGSYWYPNYLMRADASVNRQFYLRAHAGEWATDTLEVPQYPGMGATNSAFYRTGPSGGRMLRGLSTVPFAPRPRWDITPRGTIVSGDGSSYEIRETDRAGRVVRRFTRDVPRRPIPAAERRDSLAALRARLDSVPVPLGEVLNMPDDVRQARLPDVLPAFIDVQVAANGSVWVRRWPRPGRRESIFDVFTDDGRYARTIIVPATLALEPPPFMTGQTIIGVVVDATTDVESVVAFRFDLSVTERR
jgi:hypothetical protein